MSDVFYSLPRTYLTTDLAGIGGSLKQRNTDFVVEEIPAYHPCGSGEHLYLFIEKNGRATLEVIHEIARHFRVPVRSIGYAGMKDKHAITRQYVSVHTFDDSPLDTLQLNGVRVLEALRHRNRLRIGHLKGNRFEVRIRGCADDADDQARKILEVMSQIGGPNFAGEQRFGYRAKNHLVGRAYLWQDWQAMADVLLGDPDDPSDGNYEARVAYMEGDYRRSQNLWSPALPAERKMIHELARGRTFEEAIMSTSRSQRRFFVTAFQSAIFNQILDDRIERCLFDQLIVGDVAFKHVNGALFHVGESEAADPETKRRLHDLEISPTGALWGYDMLPACGETGGLEERFLQATELEMEQFVTPPHHVRGTRRPIRIPVTEAEVSAGEDEFGSYIHISFILPRGSFATAILREIMKTPKRDYPWGHRTPAGEEAVSPNQPTPKPEIT